MEGLVWAIMYMWCSAIEDFETALYVSMATFTTLGFGCVSRAGTTPARP